MKNEAEKIEIGTVVQLKSGGQKMTVTELDTLQDSKVYCVWFDATGRKCTSGFYVRTLKIFSEKELQSPS